MDKNNLDQVVAIDDLASEQDRIAIGKAMPELYRTLIDSIVLYKSSQQPFYKSERYKVLVAKNKTQTLILGYLIAEIMDDTDAETRATIEQRKMVKIVHVWVKSMWRKLHIAKSLINKLEQDCRAKKVTKLSILFDNSNEAMHALTKKKNGWSDPEFLNGYTISSRSSMYPLLKDLKRTTQRLKLKVEMRALDTDNYQRLVDCSQSSAQIPPWAKLNLKKLQIASKEFSRILFEDQKIIGWLITVPIGVDTLDYRILWTDSSYSSKALSIMALTEIIQLAHFKENNQQEAKSDFGAPWQQGFFLVNTNNRAMNHFAMKRLMNAGGIIKSLIHNEKSFH